MSAQVTLWPGTEPTTEPAVYAGLPTRAITLWQPWAWLVANGHKDLENRPAGFSFKSFRGEFWIHAGLRSDIKAIEVARSFDIAIPKLNGPDNFGAIIGRAMITGIIPPCGGGCGRRWHFHDQWGFEVRDARPVKPVRCRGYQGFWGVPADVLTELATEPSR